VGNVLDAIRSGERDALDKLVADATPLLWQVARSQGLDQDSAADAVQLTWMAFLRSLDTIQTPEAVIGWLITVTKREAWHMRTRMRRRAEVPDVLSLLAEQPSTEPLPEDIVLDEERGRVLWAAVRQLSARCQELIRVIAFAHRPDYNAISEALGMPRGSIGPTRGRCLAELRRLLAGDPGWSRP